MFNLIGIIGAMEEEVAALKAEMEDVQTREKAKQQDKLDKKQQETPERPPARKEKLYDA